MKHLIEELDNGILRITLDSERWYLDPDTKQPVPSTTWILESYPKGIAFWKWLTALSSEQEGDTIKREAGERGSRVHHAIEQLLMGNTVSFYDELNEDLGFRYKPSDWKYLLPFITFYKNESPDYIEGIEVSFVDIDNNYAGTADVIYIKDDTKYILDWKTSAYIYENYKCQVAAYAKAFDIDNAKIVQLGTRHKVGYHVFEMGPDEIEYYYDLFKSVQKIWLNDNRDAKMKVIEIQSKLTLKEEKKNEKRHKEEDSF